MLCRWSAIATHLPKRTDNEIKNYWNTHLKKRLTKMGIDPVTHKPKTDTLGSAGGNPKDAANLSHMAQWESARLEAEARSVRESKLVSNLIPQNQISAAVSVSVSASASASGSSSSSAVPLTNMNAVIAPAARPQCLDVLKAWQGVVTGMFTFSSENLQSPTSRLNFMENTLPMTTSSVGFNVDNFVRNVPSIHPCESGNNINVVKFHHHSSENDWKCLEKSNGIIPELKERSLDIHSSTMGLHEMGAYSSSEAVTAAWFQDSYCRAENMMETAGDYSDILVCDDSSGADHDNQMNSWTMVAAGDGGGESFNGTSYGSSSYEENKNYWNSILNLVNSSPSAGSPVF